MKGGDNFNVWQLRSSEGRTSLDRGLGSASTRLYIPSFYHDLGAKSRRF